MTTYNGNCHCRTVQYSVVLDKAQEELTVSACNCSSCQRRQARWAHIAEDKFTWVSGKDECTVYEWGNKAFKYLFCPKCGITVVCSSDVHEMFNGKIGVNMNTFDDLDVSKMKIFEFDGKHEIPGRHKDDPTRYP